MKHSITVISVIFIIGIQSLNTLAGSTPWEDLQDKWSFYGQGIRQMNFGSFHMKEDPEPKSAGHIAFRLRGLLDEPASCLIRSVTIEESQNQR